MSAWKKTPIGELGRVVTGSTPPTKDAANYGDGYLFVTPSDLNFDTYYVSSTQRSVTQHAYSKLKTRFVPKDAIMFTCIASIGKIGLASSAVLTNQQINSVVANEETDAKFLYYLLRHNAGFIAAHKSGVAVPIINKEAFEQIELAVPPLPTQRRIAAILSDYDAAIANCRKQIALLEEAARRLYREWFGDGKGEKKKFSDIASVCSGKRPPKRSDMMTGECSVPLFGASEQMGYTSEALYSEPILITGRVGTHGIVQRVVSPCWPSDNTLVVKSQYFAFAYQFMKQIDYGSMNRGVAQPLLTQSDLKDVAMFMPSEGLLLKYEEDAGVMLKSVDVLSQQIRSLTEARDRLLPKLMSGEVVV